MFNIIKKYFLKNIKFTTKKNEFELLQINLDELCKDLNKIKYEILVKELNEILKETKYTNGLKELIKDLIKDLKIKIPTQKKINEILEEYIELIKDELEGIKIIEKIEKEYINFYKSNHNIENKNITHIDGINKYKKLLYSNSSYCDKYKDNIAIILDELTKEGKIIFSNNILILIKNENINII